MSVDQFNLLKLKRFCPLFLTQFFGAFNDNIYKTALSILITFQFANQVHTRPEVVISIAYGIFILPFFLFSATAGQLADKYEKSTLIRYTKIAEVFLMLLAAFGLYYENIIILMTTLFLVGLQATFFGPLKYSILPDHLKTDELIAGNAFLESGTFLAILLGTILGGILPSFSFGPFLIACVIVVVALIGLLTSFWIPNAKIGSPHLKINFNFVHETWKIVQHTFEKRNVYLSILGISWFWLIGGIYITQFPTYAKDVVHGESSIVTLFLSVFTFGIGIGSLVCNRLLKGKIHATYVPLAALGMTIFAIDLVIASHHTMFELDKIISLHDFLAHFNSWRFLTDLFLLALCGGIYIVPLYAILQHESTEAYRSRAIAANNIINALFMTISAVATAFMLYLNFTVTQVFLAVALANLIVAVYICNLLPEALIKSCLIWLFKTLYRVEVRGLENYYKAGDRVLIIANHTSFLDAALLAAFLPDRLTFAINTDVAHKWWIKVLIKLVNTYSVDPSNPLATKSMIEYLRHNHRLVIFPEGRITVTGSLMKIYEGPGLIADKAKAKLLPIRIEGAQYTPLSYLRGKVKIHWFPKITLTILESRTFELPVDISSRERRKLISDQLYDIMTDSMFFSSNIQETLFTSLINAKAIHGGKHIVLEDVDRHPINYNRLILGSFILGQKIANSSSHQEILGILLPNSIANVVTFFAMQAYHRIPAMLNFSTGSQNLISACQTAQIKQIYTSKKFIKFANLQAIEAELIGNGISLIYLEDVYKKINWLDKIKGKLFSYFPRFYYRFFNGINKINELDSAQSPAVILFTSGSEGTPKGVALSHVNLQSNRFQLTSRVDFNPTDKIFNALPMFHSFGLNCATLLPIVSGMRVFMYPSPLHYRIIPELCYDTNSTIFFGTDNFLANYAKYAHPYNFYSIRYVFAGAEKLREQTRQLWIQKFGIRIFEGYGATEAAPVIATNTPMQYKLSTVGRLLPGIRYDLQSVEGISEGGRLFVSGPNIMLGYLFAHSPGKIVAPVNGWHDTGDIVQFDNEGYISIKGRVKRFAKIAGEMVSLTAVEEEIYSLWPTFQHAVLSKPDERKGEQIILVTSYQAATQNQLIEHFRQCGLPDISLPRKIIILTKLPVLGSGKIDYPTVKEILNSI